MAEEVVMSKTDLQNRYEGDLSAKFSDAYLDTKIEDAVALIEGTCPTVPARLLSGALLPNNYKRIVADIILRVVRNPGGFASESEGGVSYSMQPVVASGNLWLTQQDIDLLNGIVRRGKAAPGTIGIGLDAGWFS